MKSIVFCSFLIFMSGFACAEELKLFDVPLRTASRQEIKSAITRVGGRLTSSTRDVEKYNVKAINLPSVNDLEVVYLDNKLVFAQYHIEGRSQGNERFRKMIIEKYGQPGGNRSGFDSQYLGDGTYSWQFDGNMELVYTQEFFGSAMLTYINRTEQSRLESLVKENDKRAAKSAATAKKNLF